MEIKIIKVSEKGQIAIPIQMRERMNIDKGDELILFEVGGKILLEKSQHVAEKVEDDFKDIERYNEESLKEIWDNEEDDIWSSYLRK